MCHGPEWEYLQVMYAREVARRKLDRLKAETPKAPAIAPPKTPAEAPARNEEPVPV